MVKKKKKTIEKKEVYSIRKYKVGVGSALVGVALLGGSDLIDLPSFDVLDSLHNSNVAHAADLSVGENGLQTNATLSNNYGPGEKISDTLILTDLVINGKLNGAKAGDRIVYEVENINVSELDGYIVKDDKTGRKIGVIEAYNGSTISRTYESKDKITSEQMNFDAKKEAENKGRVIIKFDKGVENTTNISYKINLQKARSYPFYTAVNNKYISQIKHNNKVLAKKETDRISVNQYAGQTNGYVSDYNSYIVGKNNYLLTGSINSQVGKTKEQNIVKGDTIRIKINSPELQFQLDSFPKGSVLSSDRILNFTKETSTRNNSGIYLHQSSQIKFKVKESSIKEITLEILEVPPAFNVGETMNINFPVNVVATNGKVDRGAGVLKNQNFTYIYNGKNRNVYEDKNVDIKITGVNLNANLQVVDVTPTVTQEDKKYTTIEKPSDKLLKGERRVIQNGVNGKQKKIITYYVDTRAGEKVANNPIYETIKESVNEIVEVGTASATQIEKGKQYTGDKTKVRPGENGLKHPDGKIIKQPIDEIIYVDISNTVTEENIKYEVVTKNNDKMLPGEKNIAKKGENGKQKKTISYTLDEKTGKKTPNPPKYEIIKNKVDEIVEIGTGKTSPIAKGKVYTSDKNKETSGEDGVRHPNGKVIKQPKDEVIYVNTQAIVTSEKIPFKTIEKKDNRMLPTDKPREVVKGEDGKQNKIIEYTLNEKTGEKTPKPPRYEITKQPIDRVIEVGSGSTSVITKGKSFTGDKNKETKGEDGVRHPDGSIIKQSKEEVVYVNIEPTITSETIKAETIKKENNKMLPTEEKEITKGEDGKQNKIIEYTLNEKTGEKTPKPPRYEITKQKVDRVIEVGTGKTSVIPKGDFKVIEDIKLPLGKEVIDEPGEDGVLHPDGKTVLKERIQPVKRIGKPVTSHGTDGPAIHDIKEFEREFVDLNDPEVKVPEKIALGEDSTYTNPKELEKDEHGNVKKFGVKEIETKYKSDDKLEKGKTVVDDDGKETGTKIVRVGTAPTFKTEEIPFKVIDKETKDLVKGKERVATEGKVGKKEITTTYTVDEKTGEVKENKPTEKILEEAVDKVVEKGIKDPINIYITSDGTEVKEFNEKEKKDKDGNIYTEPKFKEEDKDGNKVYIVEKIKEEKGESITNELPEAKIVKYIDKDGNVIKHYPTDPKEEVTPEKEIEVNGKKYEYTGKQDKDGNYIYDIKQEIKEEVKEEPIKETPKEEVKLPELTEDYSPSPIVSKKELPKTSSSTDNGVATGVATAGLIGVGAALAMRKRKKANI